MRLLRRVYIQIVLKSNGWEKMTHHMTPGTCTILLCMWIGLLLQLWIGLWIGLLLPGPIAIADGPAAAAVKEARDKGECDDQDASNQRDQQSDVYHRIQVGNGVVDDSSVGWEGPVVVANCKA